MEDSMVIPTIRLKEGTIEIIDQTLLPSEYRILTLSAVDALCDAIRRLAIRGAPALGIAGAFGLLLAVEERWGGGARHLFDAEAEHTSSFRSDVLPSDVIGVIEAASAKIAATRPTAVNLFRMLDRMRGIYQGKWGSSKELLKALHREAVAIWKEDLEMCQALAAHGERLLKDGDSVLTHCNTGGLATSGYGTALGVVFAAVGSGKRIRVFADETRPLLQGARLTTWECVRRGIPVTVVCEGAAGYLMSRGLVSCVIVGADRIACNGDTANKIGTLNLAILSGHFGIPFYVAAPSSTVDLSISDGRSIPIEMRSPSELKRFSNTAVAAPEADALNPAFDVTPHRLIAAIITERGVVFPPYEGRIKPD